MIWKTWDHQSGGQVSPHRILRSKGSEAMRSPVRSNDLFCKECKGQGKTVRRKQQVEIDVSGLRADRRLGVRFLRIILSKTGA